MNAQTTQGATPVAEPSFWSRIWGEKAKPGPLPDAFGSKHKLEVNDLYEWQKNRSSEFFNKPFLKEQAKGMEGWRGSAARRITGTANRVNDYLQRKSRGFVEGGFKTVGEVVGAAPLKAFGSMYKAGLVLGGVVEFGLMGKPLTLSNVAGLAVDNVAFTAGSMLAGSNMGGIAKYMGWQYIGSEMGLGTWGSLGLQVAGSLFLPGAGWAMGTMALAHSAGKMVFQGGKMLHDLGKASRQPEFTTGDTSYQTQNAATMRERALGAIQNSHLNLRSILGNEARMLSMTR